MITVKKIKKMGRIEAMETLRKILLSTAGSSVKRPLIQSCERRIEQPDRNKAIATESEGIDVE